MLSCSVNSNAQTKGNLWMEDLLLLRSQSITEKKPSMRYITSSTSRMVVQFMTWITWL